MREFSRRLNTAGNLRSLVALLTVVSFLITFQCPVAFAASADGFTEPYRSIEVAAAETGLVSEVNVREGDTVSQGDVLATLDRDVLLALLAIADQAMHSTGKLDSTLAELRLRKERLAILEVLRTKGHARQEEVARARTDLAIAEAQVRSAREDLLIKKLEYEKIQAQLERRVLRAPFDGVITRVQKNAGDYVAPNDPYVVTLVQLDPLLAIFSLARDQAARLSVDQKVVVRSFNISALDDELSVLMEGTVEFIAPVIEAESGTVRVKVTIGNPDGKYQSGERCALEFSSEVPLDSQSVQ